MRKFSYPYAFFISAFILMNIISQISLSETTNLERIKVAVEEKEKILEAITLSQKLSEQELKHKQQQLYKIKENLKVVNASLEKIRFEIITIQNNIDDLSKKQAILKKRSLKRMKMLFYRKDDNITFGIFNNSENFLRDAYFSSRFTKSDERLFNELVLIQTDKQKASDVASNLLKNQDLLKKQVIEQQKLATKKILEEKQVQKRLRDNRLRIEEALAALRAEALHLETLLSSLTDDNPIQSKKIDLISLHGKATVTKFIGEGLKVRSLQKPVDGLIMRQMGKTSEFKKLISSKGVWFSSLKNKDVKAVALGRVMYLGKMPAYGNIIILDHGKRFYTLYGNLSEVNAQLGSIVKKGETIAKIATIHSKEPAFYFELRYAGKKINPGKYWQ